MAPVEHDAGPDKDIGAQDGKGVEARIGVVARIHPRRERRATRDATEPETFPSQFTLACGKGFEEHPCAGLCVLTAVLQRCALL
eukprot:3136553-Pyramimonas_sp.AAC.1